MNYKAAVLSMLFGFLPVAAFAVDNPAAGNYLGLSYGVFSTPEPTRELFGDTGDEFSVYMKQTLYGYFGFEATYGWLDAGTTSIPEFGLALFNQFYSETTLIFRHFSLGPTVDIPVGKRHAILLGAMFGFYDVGIDFLSPTGGRFDLASKSFGYSLKTGYSVSLGSNFSVSLRYDAHKVYTDNDETDLYYLITNGAGDPWMTSGSMGIQITFQ